MQLQQLHAACVTPNLPGAELELQHRPALSQILPPKKRTPCTSLDTVGTLWSTANRNAAAKTGTRAASHRAEIKQKHYAYTAVREHPSLE